MANRIFGREICKLIRQSLRKEVRLRRSSVGFNPISENVMDCELTCYVVCVEICFEMTITHVFTSCYI